MVWGPAGAPQGEERGEEKRPPARPSRALGCAWVPPGAGPAGSQEAGARPTRAGRGAGEGRGPEAEGRNYITNNPGLKL